MRRSALLGIMVLPTLLLLGGCSGLGKFFGDTITLPGDNPNLPYGLDENAERAEGRTPAIAPILPQQGNVWPGPPQPLPTLTDVAHANGNGLNAPAYGTQQQGPPLRNGGSMSMGEGDMVAHGVPTGTNDFSGGGALPTGAPNGAPAFRLNGSGVKNPPIVIPNGDGSSTVIEPDGTVKTIQGIPR